MEDALLSLAHVLGRGSCELGRSGLNLQAFVLTGCPD